MNRRQARKRCKGRAVAALMSIGLDRKVAEQQFRKVRKEHEKRGADR